MAHLYDVDKIEQALRSPECVTPDGVIERIMELMQSLPMPVVIEMYRCSVSRLAHALNDDQPCTVDEFVAQSRHVLSLLDEGLCCPIPAEVKEQADSLATMARDINRMTESDFDDLIREAMENTDTKMDD